jgi:hypothetical protein
MALTTFEFPGLPTLQSQSSSHLRTTTFAGTSLTTDTLLEERFTQPSQAFWVTKCTGCNHYYTIPTLEEGVPEGTGFWCLNIRAGVGFQIVKARIGFARPVPLL